MPAKTLAGVEEAEDCCLDKPILMVRSEAAD